MWSWDVFVVIAATLDLLCVAAVLFAERKTPASSMAWVMVLLFLPVVGFVFYLLFGAGFRVNKKRKYILKALADAAYASELRQRLDAHRDDRGESVPATARLRHYLDRAGDGGYTGDNAAEVYDDGRAFFDRMLADIRGAEKHVHLLYYIFRCDGVGGEILSALAEKARQGVEVRLMYDSLGSFLATGRKLRELREAGGQVRAFAPIFSTLSSSLRVNYRNHRKLTIVDGKAGYVGGMNVGDEYLGLDKRLTPWRDTSLRLEGPSVWFLQARFLMDWSYASDEEPRADPAFIRFFPRPSPAGNLGVQIASGGPDAPESPVKYGFLALFYAARKTLYIQTPYFAPDESILDALQSAARAGVDVRFMVPRIADHWIVQKATFGYVRQMLASGVRVFRYRGFLHAKTIVMDGAVATIGTTNLTNRSFTQDFEVNAFVHDAAFAAGEEARFRRDQENCEELTEAWFAARPWPIRAVYNVSRLLAPLI